MSDLIFMDVQLNGVSGLDVTKKIRHPIQKLPLSFSPCLIYRNTGELPQIMERIVFLPKSSLNSLGLEVLVKTYQKAPAKLVMN